MAEINPTTIFDRVANVNFGLHYCSVESEQIIIVQQLALPMSHDRRAGVMTSISFATPLELANEAFVYWFEPT